MPRTRHRFSLLIGSARYGMILTTYPYTYAEVPGFWAPFLSVSVILAQSSFFEMAEAVVASLVSLELGSTYRGTQGDEWDAQRDMAHH